MNKEPASTPLATLLRRLREEAGMTTWALAQRSGYDRANIRRIEAGTAVNLTPATMQKLADALEADVENFYEAQWETTGQSLPSLPTYFRTKYRSLNETQIAEVEAFVERLEQQKSQHPPQVD